MEWTKQKLARYIGDIRTVVEFQGITEGELERIFQEEAMRRLQQVENVIYNEYLSSGEKVAAIEKLLEAP